MTLFHLTGVALTVLLMVSSAAAQAPRPAADGADTQFLVFFRSQPVGREEVLVLRVGDEWIVRGSSRLGPPIDITSRTAEVVYDAQWRPKSLLVDGVVRGQDVTVKTIFSNGQASNVISVQGAPQTKVDAVSADAVVLPNAFLGSYAALAMRLQGLKPGAELKAYVAPQAEVTVRLLATAAERIDTPRVTVNATKYSLLFINPPPAGELPFELWTGPTGNLLRLSIPSQTLEMAREDIASSASRTAAFSLPGDEAVTIPATGFNLAGSITKPANATAPLPALVLIGGSGPTDRDETVAGIPIFGQLARDLVAAGFIVVRYDKRGVGQSGGRSESVTIADYAEDARSVVVWLEKRKDVDKARIGLVGHSEGALVAMLLAGRERGKVGAMALLAGPSASGAVVVLEQQKHLLDQMKIDDDQRAEKVALQEKINAAVISGRGWQDLPEEARKLADTPWFYSFLTIDPQRAMRDTRQPVLIVQGELDTQVKPHHADRLAEYARARRTKTETEVVKVPGVNHLLVAAKTGEVAEYASLGPAAKVAPEVGAAIAAFMTRALRD
ncbi:MAG: alpha/beta fold hydrolase [Acidobacteriota bacterium]|nr:alpha/beta fold hydrolase [Acidobacteriota bacterium]